MYDVGFIFVDSILYGILFLKTKNVYLTTLAHFLANAAGNLYFSLDIKLMDNSMKNS